MSELAPSRAAVTSTATVADRLRRALAAALDTPDPLAVTVGEEIDAAGDVVGFTLTLPPFEAVPAEPAARTAAMIRFGTLLRRITAATWAEGLEAETLLAPRTDGVPPAIRVTARPR